jgi:hypothetical protein
MLTTRRTNDSATAAIVIGTAAVAIACCAGLPAIAALIGGLTLGGILGLGLGAVLLGVLTWTATATLVRGRQRPRCDERIRDE